MAKITIPDISSGYASTTALNNAFNSIESELNSKVLYRDNPSGEPNQMENDLDMNGHSILNLTGLEINDVDVADILTTAETAADEAAASELVATAAALNAANSAADAEDSAAVVADWSFEGAWTTSTAYKVNNIVTEEGNAYICLEDHTAGTFSTDLTADKWVLFAAKGAAGEGTGDMLAANNLSDLANAASSRANLGLGTIATQSASNVAITGGAINNTTIGATTKAAIGGTTITATTGFVGNLTGNVTGTVSGNAGTVTNGIYTTNFTGANQDLDTNGLQKLPGGLVIMWGTGSSTNDNPETFNFHTAFSTACLFIIAVYGNNPYNPAITSYTSTSFTIDRTGAVDGTQAFRYFAIGY